MTINIGGFDSQPKIDTHESVVDRVSSGAASKSHQADQAAINDESTTLSKAAVLKNLVDEVASNNEIRTEKVEQLRQAIASGQYKVNATEVANAMIAEGQRLRS